MQRASYFADATGGLLVVGALLVAGALVDGLALVGFCDGALVVADGAPELGAAVLGIAVGAALDGAVALVCGAALDGADAAATGWAFASLFLESEEEPELHADAASTTATAAATDMRVFFTVLLCPSVPCSAGARSFCPIDATRPALRCRAFVSGVSLSGAYLDTQTPRSAVGRDHHIAKIVHAGIPQ
jgi:hypothetical protein